MSTLMTLLYVIHPLKVFKERTYERLSGYSFGGASVLSLDFEKYMKDIMKNVVLGHDIVPRLSFGSIRDLCKIMLAFDEINVDFFSANDINFIRKIIQVSFQKF